MPFGNVINFDNKDFVITYIDNRDNVLQVNLLEDMYLNLFYENSKIDILYRSEYSMFSNQNFRKWFEEKFQLDRYDISNGDINLVFKGYIELEMGVKINCEIFEVEIGRRNNIGIIIETKNFAFLPNHPIYKQRQYEIWKLNAPRLAKVLEEFNNNTHFDLLSEAGDFGKTASISSNIYYLQNGPITGVEDENWDEFYIPFNLLNHDPSSKY